MLSALRDPRDVDTSVPDTSGSVASHRVRRVLLVILAPLLASAALLIVSADRLDAPFSPSFPGFNTAVWATGSRAVRSDGWWETRLGAAAGPSGSTVPYAHHPPLVRVEVTVAEMALGEHRWVDRLPALLSSLAAIWLCWGWLGASGFSPGPRSLGVLALGGTGMMLTYGVMLNMEAIWLPVAFALLWAWQRAERDDSGGGFWSCLLLGLLGCAAAHQGMLLAGGLALLGIVSARRAHRRLRPHESAMIVASAVGVTLFFTWAIWASGGVSDLVRIARERSGAEFGWGEFLRSQVEHSVSVIGLIGIGCVIAAIALVHRRPRLIGQLVVVCGVTLAYAVAFRQGATIHEYWNAAVLPVVALGGALLGDRLTTTVPRVVPFACAGVAVMMFLSAVAVTQIRFDGDAAGLLAREAGARAVPVLYSTEIVSEWVTYESRRPVEPVYSCRAVRTLAEKDPDAPVLTSARWLEGTAAGGWRLVSEDPTSTVIDDYALATASSVAAHC